MSDTDNVGGVVSTTLTSAVQSLGLPSSSKAVNFTWVTPSGKNDGPSLESVGEASHTSVAEAPARNAAMAGSLAGLPPGELHSTVIDCGQVMTGGVVSTTRTDI